MTSNSLTPLNFSECVNAAWQVPVAGDDIQWENNDSIWHPNVHRFHFFASMKGLFALLLVAFAGAVAYKFQHEKKRKLGHRSYDAIDDTGSM